MNNYYITFGQRHIHSINGITWDKDIVCLIKAKTEFEARDIAFDNFGDAWFTSYITLPDMKFFPRGVKELK